MAADRFDLDEALRLERKAIWGHPAAGAPAPQASALCLSGGGIRSASFCLGVLQSLAKEGLLPHFHYLSTVSGGGYIGSWLQAWLLENARTHHREAVSAVDISEVASALGDGVAGPVARLRDFTSFITPQSGLISRDTWAGIVIYLRNFLINWAIFLPALFALALAPRLYHDLLVAIPYAASRPLFLAALVGVAAAAFFTASRLPSHDAGTPPDYAGIAEISSDAVVPAVAWAALLPMALAPALIGRDKVLGVWGLGPAASAPAAMFAVLLVVYAAAWLRTWFTGRDAWMFGTSLLPWVIACLAASLLLSAQIAVAMLLLPPGALLTPNLLAIAGPAAVMLTHLTLSTVFIALRVEVKRSDLDREWLARLSGVKVVPTLLWAVLAAACLLGHAVIIGLNPSKAWTSANAALTAVSGVAGALLGKSTKTSAASASPVPFDVLASLCTFVFAVGLMSLLSYAASALLDVLAGADRVAACVLEALGIAVFFAVAWALGQRINVNRFSLHGIYRNRLVRAFLGTVRVPARMAAPAGHRVAERMSANPRTPDPFTDLDPDDNLSLHMLLPAKGGKRHLFPVIGTTLNLVEGAARAGQQRKGAPFFITPAACGSPHLAPARDAFIATADYAGFEEGTGTVGMSLGTAAALSGAAVSPSSGYHSSPWTAFLMTLFNVRLGAWFANPAASTDKTVRRGKPPNALYALFREMLGLTNGDSPSIYLTDGGHFDNLGIYEMIRRRCLWIVAIDAGEDGDFAFADLGSAVRLVRIDFDVEIAFTMPMPMGSEEKWSDTSRAFALAKINYPATDTEPAAVGTLLYIKPCRQPQMPIDVRSYALQDASFPADSTANQFFTESQFESYRRLGLFIGELAQNDATVRPFVDSLRAIPV